MKAEAKSMQYLSTVKQFEIPYFQRAYVWEEQNWVQLIEQWKYGKDTSHFLGPIIVNNPYTSTDKNYQNVEIIDGQQRLTTLTIMYKAIYDILISNSTSEIEKGKYISEKDKILGEENLKIIHSELDSKYYNDIMKGNVPVAEIILPSEVKSLQRGNSKKKFEYPRIYQCYRFFYKYFSFNIDKTKKMWEDLNSITKMLFVVIDIDSNDDAQQIFDCTNSAGVRLTISDLVKNDLFRKMKNYYNNSELKEIYDASWRKTFEVKDTLRDFWETSKTIGRIKRNNLELLLYCVLEIIGAYTVNKNKITELYIIFKDYIEKCDKVKLRELLDKIVSFARIYYKTFKNEWGTQSIAYTNRIALVDFISSATDATVFYPFIIKSIYENKFLDAKLSVLIKLMLRVAISQDTITSKDFTNANYLLVTGNKTIDDYYKERMDKGSISDEDVRKGLKSLENRNRLAKLVLFLLELKLRANDNMYDNNSKELKFCYSLEHIMPQKYTTHWSFDKVPVKIYDENEHRWIVASNITDSEKDEKRKEAIYSIGNMALLSKGANSKNSNKYLGNVNDKDSKIYTIDRYGKDLIVNNDFINVYRNIGKWDEEDIYKRTERLTGLIINELLKENESDRKNAYNEFLNTKVDEKIRVVPESEISSDFNNSKEHLGIVNWSAPTFKDIEKSKPVFVEINNKKIEVSTWRNVLNTIFEYLYFDKNYKNMLLELFLDKESDRGFRSLLVSKIAFDNKEQKKYKKIENGVFLYNYYNTSYLLNKIVEIMQKLHINQNDIKVYY